MEIEEKESWEERFDKTFNHDSDCELLRFRDFEKEPFADCYCELKHIKSFIRQTLTSDRLSLVEVLQKMKKPTNKSSKKIRKSLNCTCNYPCYADCHCWCHENVKYNEAVTDIISRLKV